MILHYKDKKKKGYSLLEVLVSMTIVGFSMIVMVNFLVLGLKVNIISLNRSFVRGELSNMTSLMARDFRNAASITCTTNTCTFTQDDGSSYLWSLNSGFIVKDKLTFDRITQTQGYVLMYGSSPNLVINSLNFDNGYTNTTLSNQRNIIITISASSANKTVLINNVIKQLSVSLRNF